MSVKKKKVVQPDSKDTSIPSKKKKRRKPSSGLTGKYYLVDVQNLYGGSAVVPADSEEEAWDKFRTLRGFSSTDNAKEIRKLNHKAVEELDPDTIEDCNLEEAL